MKVKIEFTNGNIEVIKAVNVAIYREGGTVFTMCAGRNFRHKLEKVSIITVDNEIIYDSKHLKKSGGRMNKYQKALNYLAWHCSAKHTEQQDLLQELVDKAAAIKPIIKSSGLERCGKCKYQYNPDNDCYCSQCGQCRDWGDEELAR